MCSSFGTEELWDIEAVLRLHRSGCVGRVEFRRNFDAQWISLIGFFSLSELSNAVRPLQLVAPERLGKVSAIEDCFAARQQREPSSF